MLAAISILNIFLPLGYTVTAFFYGRAFLKGDEFADKHKSNFLSLTLFMHFLSSALRTAEFRHIPVTSFYELMGMLALTISAAYLFIEFSTKVRNTGFPILAICTVLVLLDSLFYKQYYGVQDVLKSELLAFHVIAALVGYSSFTLSAVYGFLYVILYKKLRSKTFDTVYQNLPSLESLEKLANKGIIIGFIALAFSIVIGFIWLPRAIESFSKADAQFIGVFLTLVVYGVGISVIKFAGLRGRRLALLAVIGFIVMCISVIFANTFTGFHNFR
ncbi:MAG TPA: cytochrome c biogenesis protein CcsA [Patescibacteria group bacterium]|nr:cytochrome c biogenesis protein CcsA [Patescibacteria group bacterium]